LSASLRRRWHLAGLFADEPQDNPAFADAMEETQASDVNSSTTTYRKLDDPASSPADHQVPESFPDPPVRQRLVFGAVFHHCVIVDHGLDDDLPAQQARRMA